MTEFTSEMARTMSNEDILQFWKNRQIEQRKVGGDFYDRLIDVATNEVVASI